MKVLMKRLLIGRLFRNIFFYLFLCVISFFILSPFLWGVLTSLKPKEEIFHVPPLLPSHITLENYFQVFSVGGFTSYFKNSIIVVSIATIITVGCACLAAYSFSRYKFRGRGTLFVTILITQLLPMASILIPLFLFWNTLGMLNTYLVLIITYVGFTSPLAIWLLKSYFDAIPIELEESAIIDGCSSIGAFLRIVIPLSAPGIGAVTIYVFIAAWQEFLFALTFISDSSLRTLPIGLNVFIQQHGIDWGGLMAGATISTMPVMIFFVILRRTFIGGITRGAIKG